MALAPFQSLTSSPLAIASPPAFLIGATTSLAGEASVPLPSTPAPMSLTTTLAPWAASSRACSRPEAPSCPRHDGDPSLAQAAHGSAPPRIVALCFLAISLFRGAIPRKMGRAMQPRPGGPRGRGNTTTAGADAGDQAFLGRHAAPANCACSAATTAATPISRRGRSAPSAPRARCRW